mgnify:CR=1 FL=1
MNKKTDDFNFPSFTDMFDEFSDDDLIAFAKDNPLILQKLCIFLTIDLQLSHQKTLANLIEKKNIMKTYAIRFGYPRNCSYIYV